MWRDFVRSQIDNCMRIFAAFIAESQTDFIDGFFVGKKISDMKDNRGNKMKDYILRQRLAEYDAKLDLVYRNFSEYVHLAEKAFYSSVTTSSSEQYDIEFSVGLPLKEKANPVLLEVANAFVYYVKLQNNLVMGGMEDYYIAQFFCWREIILLNLEIDIETFSSVNLAKAGVYRYAESPDFEVLLFGYSVDGGEVKVGDLVKGEKIPEEVMSALEDEAVTKWAFNAQFERICISRMLGYEAGTYLVPASWKCSMVWSAYMGLPLSLEGVGAVLGLEKQKLTEGKDLILERQSQRTR